MNITEIKQKIATLKPSIPAGWNSRTWQETLSLDANLNIVDNTPLKNMLTPRSAPKRVVLRVEYNGVSNCFECSEARMMKFLAKLE